MSDGGVLPSQQRGLHRIREYTRDRRVVDRLGNRRCSGCCRRSQLEWPVLFFHAHASRTQTALRHALGIQ